MIYEIKFTSRFKKDYKRMVKQNKNIDILHQTIEMMAKGKELTEKYKDHELSGNFKGKRECHLQPDWLLMYQYNKNELVLLLIRTGSHSEILDM